MAGVICTITKHFLENLSKDINNCALFGTVRNSGVKTVFSVSMVEWAQVLPEFR
jgi:hypothetical protein